VVVYLCRRFGATYRFIFKGQAILDVLTRRVLDFWRWDR
jgi:hypothetical protein